MHEGYHPYMNTVPIFFQICCKIFSVLTYPTYIAKAPIGMFKSWQVHCVYHVYQSPKISWKRGFLYVNLLQLQPYHEVTMANILEV